MKTQTEEIGLNKAKQYLEKNIEFESGKTGTNRPTSARLINNYAVEMLKDRWHHTHQGIGFDLNGNLVDGQQRLMALVQACTIGAIDGDREIPPNPKLRIKFQVTFGLSPNVFPYLDRGKTRGSNQVLSMAGYTNTLVLASAARLVYLFVNFDPRVWTIVKASSEELLETVEKYKIDEANHIGYKLDSIGMIKSAAMQDISFAKLHTKMDRMTSSLTVFILVQI